MFVGDFWGVEGYRVLGVLVCMNGDLGLEMARGTVLVPGLA